MPRIPQEVLRCVFFLYDTRDAAESGHGTGGTGFLLSQKLSLYGITNYHVAKKRGCSVARITAVDGSVRILELDPSDWHSIPGGFDVAAVELPWELVATPKGYIPNSYACALDWTLMATDEAISQ